MSADPWIFSGGASGSLQIRVASADDCRAIAELHVASWQAAYASILDAGFLSELSVDRREEAWRRVLAQAQSALYVATVDSSILGFSSFGPSRDADAPAGRAELCALYVHPRSWSTGVGRELWLASCARLGAQAHSSVSLWVLQNNARAIQFYSAAGFEVDAGSGKAFELGGTSVVEVRMVRAI